jgi:hypothetical protein
VFIKKISCASALVLALLIGCGLSGPPAQAGFIVDLTEMGSDVVATGSGTIDLTNLSFASSNVFLTGVSPDFGSINTGPSAGGLESAYRGFTGPMSFGNGGVTLANSGSGDVVTISGGGGVLAVPSGYASGNPLSDTSTYNNATSASLGVTPGTYVWTWGTGTHADSFTLIAFPGPVSFSTTGVGPFTFEADTFSLSGSSGSFDPRTSSVTTANINQANFNVGNSGDFSGSENLTLAYNLTLAGVTHAVSQNATWTITPTQDTFVTLQASTPVLFDLGANGVFDVTLDAYTIFAGPLGDYIVQTPADFAAVPAPDGLPVLVAAVGMLVGTKLLRRSKNLVCVELL